MKPLQALQVSKDGRYLEHGDGTPFFWLGDTAWELFHKLNREEAELYLSNRASLRFNVIQAVALAEKDGLNTGNAYGRRPLKQNARGQYDPALPDTDGDYHYWSHVDYIVEKAAALGLYIAFLPTWGDKYNKLWGIGPAIFNAENAFQYGTWLGERYKDSPNIIWVLGGDRPLHTSAHFAVNRALAKGLRQGDGGSHLITFHPCGGQSSSLHVHEEEWLDFNMIQSGHHEWIHTNYLKVAADYAREPVKPTLDGEPCYEDHPIDFKTANGYYDQWDVRTAAYYAVFAGAFGHTYGHHSIWSMITEPNDYSITDWKTALNRPGAVQMQHLRKLVEDYSVAIRTPDQELIIDNYPGANHLSAVRGSNWAMIYSPTGLPFRAAVHRLGLERLIARWYDPRTGSYAPSEEELDGIGEVRFTPPSSGRGCDWVLVVEARGRS